MTLYRNLGPISFQCQTDSFELFSTTNQTLILQFRNPLEFDSDQINELLATYQLILKQEQILEIYTQKNKPSSILIHKAVRVGFEKINIQLLCRIIKEMITSIFHSKKIIPLKVGQIHRQMFFQIDGQLRYLYFPIKKHFGKSDLVIQVIDFFNQLKDDSQVSHRLLLKKISKCSTLEQILEQTQYFVNIYHAKQIQPSYTYSNNASQQSFLSRAINKSKGFGRNTLQNNFAHQYRNSAPLNANNETSNFKLTNRKKYNLFKTAESNNFRSTLPQNNTFVSNTWRKPQTQNSLQSSTFRVTSKAVHVDLSQPKNSKQANSSFFNRASSVTQSPKKMSNSKKKNSGLSFHQQNIKNTSFGNDSMLRRQSRDYSKKQQNNRFYEGQQITNFNQSILSKNIEESMNDQKSLNQTENNQKTSSSQLMKQMVHNSLQKWKNKSNQKASIFTKIKQKQKDGSTQVDSRSKFLQKYDRPSCDMLRQSKLTTVSQGKQQQKYIQTNKIQTSQVQSLHPIGSQRKIKKMVTANRSVLVDQSKNQFNQKNIVKNSIQPEFSQIHGFFQKQKHQLYEKIQESLQQIDLCKSSIQHLAMKNKQQELKMQRKMQRKKTSIKQINLENNKFQKNISDQSQTQRIQYSRCSKKNLNQEKISKNNKNYYSSNELKEYSQLLTGICYQKQQIDYIGVAVVQTTQHLKSFESIFWQLPMFFLYKKFFQKRIKLFQNTNELLTKITSNLTNIPNLNQLAFKTDKYLTEIQVQNTNIEQSLKKLLKTVKKKIKKQYTNKAEHDNIEKHLHLDYTIVYDNMLNQFVSMYLNSLLEAKPQFPELIFHIVDIIQALIVYKGHCIEANQRQKIEKIKQKSIRLQETQNYYDRLVKIKDIKAIIWPSQGKTKTKK